MYLNQRSSFSGATASMSNARVTLGKSPPSASPTAGGTKRMTIMMTAAAVTVNTSKSRLVAIGKNQDTRYHGTMTVEIEGVTLHLAHPDDLSVRWVGQEELMRQLLGAWLVVNEQD